MRPLYPLGDIDLLDAYHLCEGRVVTYRTYGAGWRSSGASSAGVDAGDGARASGSSASRPRCEPPVSGDLASFCDADDADYRGSAGSRDRTTAAATPTGAEEEVRGKTQKESPNFLVLFLSANARRFSVRFCTLLYTVCRKQDWTGAQLLYHSTPGQIDTVRAGNQERRASIFACTGHCDPDKNSTRPKPTGAKQECDDDNTRSPIYTEYRRLYRV